MGMVPLRADRGFLSHAERQGMLPVNPAVAGFLEQPDLSASLRTGPSIQDIQAYSLSIGVPGLGFSLYGTDSTSGPLSELRFISGASGRVVSTGVGFITYRGDGSDEYGPALSSGVVVRGTNYASLGITGTMSLTGSGTEGVADLSIRPFGTPLLSLHGDYAIDNTQENLLSGDWTLGATAEPLPGVRVSAGYASDRGVHAGIHFSAGRVGVGYTASGLTAGTGEPDPGSIWSARIGAYDRNVFDTVLARPERFLELRIPAGVSERGTAIFDTSPNMRALVAAIEDAGTDPTIGGIVVNARDMSPGQARAFELAEHLNRFRSEGREVVLFLENAGMDALYLIAAADHVIMDPYGGLFMPGFFAETTYLADLLSQAGIGAEEFRFEAYKSGFESFVRSDMSEAERLQRTNYVDHYFDTVVSALVVSGRMGEQALYDLIDFAPAVSATMLETAGLVDSLERYTDVDTVLEGIAGRSVLRTGAAGLVPRNAPQDVRWEAPARIGVVYAIGEVMSDSGMNTRRVAQDIRRMTDDTTIEAILLRVDSPGGSILASELLAAEVRRAVETKPLVVSMGGLAASGGYWISMYADTIFAEHLTLTGSIGVIGGWFSDQGLSRRLFLETDGVQRGRSADLFSGAVLPLVGLQLPGRGLTDVEREEFLSQTEAFYTDFVERVADARGLDPDFVQSVAQGRIWTGPEAVELGLVDQTGTFTDALAHTIALTGIRPGRRVELVSAPSLPVFSIPDPVSLLFGSRTAPESPVSDITMVSYLQALLENNGQPVALVPFETVNWYFRNSHRQY